MDGAHATLRFSLTFLHVLHITDPCAHARSTFSFFLCVAQRLLKTKFTVARILVYIHGMTHSERTKTKKLPLALASFPSLVVSVRFPAVHVKLNLNLFRHVMACLGKKQTLVYEAT
jgi:hypothetical protein